MKTLSDFIEGETYIRVLYAEDDQMQRDIFTKYLERKFDDVDTAENGLKALELFKQKSYDILITDVRMPKMDGLELIKTIHTLGYTPQIVITSAFSEQEYLIEAIEQGVTRYILKPIKREYFKKMLDETKKLVMLEKNLQQYQNTISQIIDAQDALLFLTTGTKLLLGNQRLFDVIGHKDIETFVQEYRCICDLFIEDEGYLNKAEFEKAIRNYDAFYQGLKQVKLFDHMLGINRAFLLKITRYASSFYLITMTDVSELQHTQDKLKAVNEKLSYRNHLIDQYIITLESDKEGVMLHASKAFYTLSGYSEEEVIGKSCAKFMFDSDSFEKHRSMIKTMQTSGLWEGELKLKGRDGKELWLSAHCTPRHSRTGELKSITMVSENITDKKTVERLSFTDQLTGVYNRRKLDMVLEYEYKIYKRYAKACSVVIIDIDFFKEINDKHGHLIGDRVLHDFSELVNEHVREVDRFGRWGGEEFLVVLGSCVKTEAGEVAEKLRVLIETHPFVEDISLTASFGVAQLTDEDATVEGLIRRADKALYMAKSQGRNCVIVL